MDIHKQPIAKIIRDPIHDYIKINETERKIIDSYPFQRLRYIHQNGTAYLTYPSAHATRFEHSIGTMHLAGLMVESALRNSNEDILESFLKACKRALKLPEDISLERVGEKVYQLIRLAGLLHDIGHLPYSHTFESLFEDQIENVYQKQMVELWRQHSRKQETPKLQLHELITLETIKNDESIKALLGDEDSQFICNILHPVELGNQDMQLVFNTLHDVISSDVDADRCDYLMRDGQLSGADFGHFDIGRLIHSMLLGKLQKTGEPPSYYIRPSIKAQSAVEGLFVERYKLYKWVYRHHRVFATDTALEKIFSILLGLERGEKEKPGPLNDLLVWPDCFYQDYSETTLAKVDHPTYFDDVHVLEMLTKIYQRLLVMNRSKIDLQVLKILLEELLFRKKRIFPLWKTDEEYQDYNRDGLWHRVRDIYDQLFRVKRQQQGLSVEIRDQDRPPLLQESGERMPLNWLVQECELHQIKNRKVLEEIYNEKINNKGIPVQVMIGAKKFPSEKEEYHFVGTDSLLVPFSRTPLIAKLREAERCGIYMHIFVIPLKDITSREQQDYKNEIKELLLPVIEEFVKRLGLPT